MKYLKSFLENNSRLILGIFIVISLGLHIYNFGFPCLNSDEASFAYNGYSIAKTGKDEYGAFMPYRFKAFGENKLPVTIYTIAPLVGLFGLNEFTARLPFIAIGVFSPLIFYWLSVSFFKNKYVGYISAFLASLSPWIQIMSRHIHENIIMLLLASALLIFFTKLQKDFRWKYVIIISILNVTGLFTYHIGKILSVYSFIVLLFILFKEKKLGKNIIIKSALIFLLPVFIFLYTEMSQPTNRVGNLFFTGLYFLFQKKEQHRFLLLPFLLMAPVSAALSWQDYSITRSFLMIIPILMLAPYGAYHLIQEAYGKLLRLSLIVAILLFYSFFQYFSWDYYFFHYPKKQQAI